MSYSNVSYLNVRSYNQASNWGFWTYVNTVKSEIESGIPSEEGIITPLRTRLARWLINGSNESLPQNVVNLDDYRNQRINVIAANCGEIIEEAVILEFPKRQRSETG